MVLSDERQIIQVWNKFAEAGFRYATTSGEVYELGTVDEDRQQQLPTRQKLLQKFLDGELDLESFKSRMAAESERLVPD